MAAIPMAVQPAALQPEPRDSISLEPRDQIARLAALYDEARETALLANLVGRVPLLIAGLGIGAAATAWTAGGATIPLVTWLVLICGGLIAMVRAYRHALSAPFDRESLLSFSGDLTAISLYAGFAWGAGGFLALGGAANMVPALAFSAGASLFVAVVVQRRDTALAFLLPATMLTGAASFARAAAEGAPAALATLTVGLLIAGGLYAAESLMRRAPLHPLVARSEV